MQKFCHTRRSIIILQESCVTLYCSYSHIILFIWTGFFHLKSSWSQVHVANEVQSFLGQIRVKPPKKAVGIFDMYSGRTAVIAKEECLERSFSCPRVSGTITALKNGMFLSQSCELGDSKIPVESTWASCTVRGFWRAFAHCKLQAVIGSVVVNVNITL